MLMYHCPASSWAAWIALRVALRLIGLLNRQDLREVARDPHAPLRVVAALQRRLKPRL